MRSATRVAVLVVAAHCVAGPGLVAPARAQEHVDGRALVEEYVRDRDAIAGFHGLALSQAAVARDIAYDDAWRRRLDALGPQPEAPVDDRVDLLLLSDLLEERADERRDAAARDAVAEPLVAFAPPLVALEEARRALEPVAPEDAAAALDTARRAIEDLRRRADPNCKDADALKLPQVAVLRASRRAEALRQALAAWFRDRDGYEPDFAWWARTPHAALDTALRDYAVWLRETVAGVKGDGADAPIVGEPIGRDALLDALRHERIPYTPEELIAIAEREMAWCDAEGVKAAQDLGLDGDWMRAVALVKDDHVAPGDMPRLVAEQAREAIAFVEERRLVTVPDLCKELWRLEMISADGQRTLPFAAYGGDKMLVAYPTESMSYESKLMSLRGNNRRFSRIVVPHELVPGHHLQLYQAARHHPWREAFRTPFLVEGWALYWETRLWELGWAQGAEDRVGMLFWRKHRCARVIVSLGYHLGTLSTEQMIEFLTTRVGLEKDGATAEVRRYVGGGYGPLYQCAYLIGGLQLRALHRELVASGRMDERTFHDAVLAQGSVPVEVIRSALTGEVPAPGTPPRWRFAD